MAYITREKSLRFSKRKPIYHGYSVEHNKMSKSSEPAKAVFPRPTNIKRNGEPLFMLQNQIFHRLIVITSSFTKEINFSFGLQRILLYQSS